MSSEDSPSTLFSGTVNYQLAACAAHRYSRIAMAIEAYNNHPSRTSLLTRRRWRIGLALELVSTSVSYCAVLTSPRSHCAISSAPSLFMAAPVVPSFPIVISIGLTQISPTPTLSIGRSFRPHPTYDYSLG